uniref:NADH deshydrogenase subunit 4L n=1 Tax=Scirtidae sp. GENSP01 TaxID=1205580 RepID=A0A0S2MQ08_9COLE|nr:NADH deshydrogenase subunit 4L [Scirtidae sp. GENSP01]
MLIFFNLFSFIFMYFVGIFMYSSKRKHLLLMLLSLEFIVLSLYMIIFFIYLCMILSIFLFWCFNFKGLWSSLGAIFIGIFNSFLWEWFFSGFEIFMMM